MKASDYNQLSPEGKILANELFRLEKILIELRDGVSALDDEHPMPEIARRVVPPDRTPVS